MSWQEITVITDQEGTEAAANAFMEVGAGGVCIHDPQLIANYKRAGIWDYDDFPDDIFKDKTVKVIGYLPLNEHLRDRLAHLKMILKDSGITFGIDLAEVKEEDWATTWKAYYKPERVTQSIVIKPTWESYQSEPDDIILELDPGMAFGTGTHPTTVMCLKALEKYLKHGDRLIDVGTGSGVLAIGGAKLGASEVLAVDFDEIAVDAAHENIALNQADAKVKAVQGNLLDLLTSDTSDLAKAWQQNPPNVVVSNIIARIIIMLTPDVAKIIRHRGIFITSGIIKERLDDVLTALAEHDFEVLEAFREGEWAAVVARKN